MVWVACNEPTVIQYNTSPHTTRVYGLGKLATQLETLRAMRKCINGDKCDALRAGRTRPADGAAYM